MNTTMNSSKVLDIEDVEKSLRSLRNDFEDAKGQGSSSKYYIMLHKLSIMSDDTVNNWNRVAHPVLMAYFFSLALGLDEALPDLKKTFEHYAAQPVINDDQTYSFTPNTDEMLASVHSVIGTYLRGDTPEYVSDHPEIPAA